MFQLVNLLSGGALLKLSVFALGIMPYITASIILQLLVKVIPRLETLRQEGQSGQAKITQYTRYLTVGLAILQSTGIVALTRSGNLIPGCQRPLIPNPTVFTITTMVITMTAGTAVIMWLGELITDRGVGNGMSLMIFTQVIAVIPGEMLAIYREKHAFVFLLVLAVGRGDHRLRGLHGTGAAPDPGAVRETDGRAQDVRRHLDLHPAEGEPGRRHPGHLRVIAAVHPAARVPAVREHHASAALGQLDLDPPERQRRRLAVLHGAFFLLIVFFTYFYVSITFDPVEVADNMKKYGGFIPGIRPGRPTSEYLNYVLTRLTAPGSVYLACVALIPMIAIGLVGASSQFPLGGTSILIAVGVGLDTVKQIESQLQQRNYEGFLR